MNPRYYTLPTFNQNYLAHHLYAIPRIVTEDNVELLSKDLMQGFLWHGSETVDSINRFINVTYGPATHPDFPKGIYGLKLKFHNLLLSEIIDTLAETQIPDEVNEEFTDLTLKEWQSGIKAVAQVLKAFEKPVGYEHTNVNGLRLRDRSISHKLYSSSLIADGFTLALIRDSFRHDNIFEDEIDYDLVDYQNHFFDPRYGLCIKDKNVLLSMLVHHIRILPDALASKYPFLNERSGLDTIPRDFRFSHSGKHENPDDWVKNYGHTFPTLWFVVPFTAFAVLNVFERNMERK